MDNKRMFSAPLELLERVCMLPSKESMLANHQGIIDRGRAQDELRALLAQPPVAQHQGETVTAICRDCFTEQPKGVPCKTCAGVEAKRSAQHQGEPVAWAETDVLDFMSVALRHAEYSGLSPSDILDGLRYMSDKGKPAFYAGEAERLRAELVEWKKRCQYNANTAHDVGRERDTLHTELAEAQQKYRDELGKRLAGEVKSEAKLAERDALLRDINKRHSSGVDFDLPADLAARVAAVCATSAEPIIDLCAESANEFVPFRTECVRCGEPYSAEPSAPKCKYCGDTGQFMVGSSGDPSDGNAPIMERCEDCELGQTSAPVEPCKHEWSDDGGLLLVCTACGAQEDHAPHWRDMASAPRDGTMLRLLVAFEEHPTEDADEAPTIGSNNFDNDGEDRWQFAGWCWTHDHFTDGKGEPVGWLPMLDAPKTTAGHGLHCLTCNDEGAIGNIENAEPCPDCAAAPPEFEQVKP